jgi:hypothetical protein
MRSRQLACLVFSMVAVVFAQTARGDILAEYTFTDVEPSMLNRNATTVATNVTAGQITDAPIVFTHPMVVLARATDIGYATQPVLAASRAPWDEANLIENVYFSFEISPDSGFELDLDELTFNTARGGAATPRVYEVRTSGDGFAASLTGGEVEILTQRPTWTPVSIDLSGAAFQNLTSPLTFRIHYMTQMGQFGQNIDFDDIRINGMVMAVDPGLTGDYNEDGVVDAADYVVWRKSAGDFGGQQGFEDWRANFGNSLSGSGSHTTVGVVPEPATWLLAVTALWVVGQCRRRY